MAKAGERIWIMSVEPYDDEHWVEVFADYEGAEATARGRLDEDAETETSQVFSSAPYLESFYGEDDWGIVRVTPATLS